MQAMERDLCTLLNTLAVSLLNEAAGSAEKKEGRPVNKGKGKKRAADTGKPQRLSHSQEPLHKLLNTSLQVVVRLPCLMVIWHSCAG